MTAICQKALRDHRLNWPRFYRNCRKIIEVFDRMPLRQEQKPKVGIVGEVLVKYMPLANNHLIEVLEKEGMEVVMPGMIEFLQYCFWNAQYRAEHLGGKRDGVVSFQDGHQRHEPHKEKDLRAAGSEPEVPSSGVYRKDPPAVGENTAERRTQRRGLVFTGRDFRPHRKGVSNIVCVQPFGCLPNHIVGKGIIKRVRELYPEANITAVDYDPGASEVNQLNRIKLMIQSASK